MKSVKELLPVRAKSKNSPHHNTQPNQWTCSAHDHNGVQPDAIAQGRGPITGSV